MSAQPSPSAQQLALWVAAWHNRHPLALRVRPEQVRGIGVVALPFAGHASGPAAAPNAPPASPEAGLSLRERALAKAQQTTETAGAPADGADSQLSASSGPAQPLQAGFVEDFISPLSPTNAARFAARHGIAADPSAGSWPRREVTVDAGLCRGSPPCWRYLNTAALETQDRRVRVLIAADGSPAIIGTRLWDRGRMLGLGVAVAAAIALMVIPLSPATETTQTAAVSAPGPVETKKVDEPAALAPEAAAPTVPPPAAPAASDAPPVSIRPRLDPEVARAARAQAVEMRAARQAEVAAEVPASAPADKGEAGKSYALVARQTKSRAASELLLTVMATEAGRQGRTEVVRSADGFRASWWPFASREDAELARERLAGQGLPVDVVEF